MNKIREFKRENKGIYYVIISLIILVLFVKIIIFFSSRQQQDTFVEKNKNKITNVAEEDSVKKAENRKKKEVKNKDDNGIMGEYINEVDLSNIYLRQVISKIGDIRAELGLNSNTYNEYAEVVEIFLKDNNIEDMDIRNIPSSSYSTYINHSILDSILYNNILTTPIYNIITKDAHYFEDEIEIEVEGNLVSAYLGNSYTTMEDVVPSESISALYKAYKIIEEEPKDYKFNSSLIDLGSYYTLGAVVNRFGDNSELDLFLVPKKTSGFNTVFSDTLKVNGEEHDLSYLAEDNPVVLDSGFIGITLDVGDIENGIEINDTKIQLVKGTDNNYYNILNAVQELSKMKKE